MHTLFKITAALSLASTIQAGFVTSHTFFSLRPNFQSAMPERVSLFRNDLLDECQGFGGAFEAVFYGGVTTEEGSEKIARFLLLPGCVTTCINVKEYNTEANEACPPSSSSGDGNPTKDVEARHFNIRTVNESFASTVCFKPEQKLFGLGLCYKQTLSNKADGTTGFWFEGSLPIERVENSVKLCETITNDGGGPITALGLDDTPIVGNMREAFAQKGWRFGRITPEKHKKWGVADVELKIGYNSCACDTYTMNSYVGLIVPTGTRIRARYVFEPVVGNNRHFGVSLGSSFAFEIWRHCQYTIMMYVDNDTRYLLSNHQVRSFDLIGKPWGRYMSTYKTSEEAAFAANTFNANSGTSGINVFTQCVRVSPHLSSNVNTGFLLTRASDCASWMLEGGYNFFARQSEVIELECGSAVSSAAFKSVLDWVKLQLPARLKIISSVMISS